MDSGIGSVRAKNVLPRTNERTSLVFVAGRMLKASFVCFVVGKNDAETEVGIRNGIGNDSARVRGH
jgi:phosphate/sulfate permease